mmetsp:Transcript_27908/g.81991  ORF Transcript_27908/g.81991 Transcript_27908/m.81991 type:complete len:229 (+) Transcript_27908:117-803(+)
MRIQRDRVRRYVGHVHVQAMRVRIAGHRHRNYGRGDRIQEEDDREGSIPRGGGGRGGSERGGVDRGGSRGGALGCQSVPLRQVRNTQEAHRRFRHQPAGNSGGRPPRSGRSSRAQASAIPLPSMAVGTRRIVEFQRPSRSSGSIRPSEVRPRRILPFHVRRRLPGRRIGSAEIEGRGMGQLGRLQALDVLEGIVRVGRGGVSSSIRYVQHGYRVRRRRVCHHDQIARE